MKCTISTWIISMGWFLGFLFWKSPFLKGYSFHIWLSFHRFDFLFTDLIIFSCFSILCYRLIVIFNFVLLQDGILVFVILLRCFICVCDSNKQNKSDQINNKSLQIKNHKSWFFNNSNLVSKVWYFSMLCKEERHLGCSSLNF